MFRSPRISTGYEPKPRNYPSPHSAPQRREKVHDDLIKVLPDFSYEMVSRKKFERALGRMLRGIGGAFMVKNISRPNPDHSVHMAASSTVGAGPRFFSPKLDRAELATQSGVSLARARVASYPSHQTKYAGGGLPMPSPVGDMYEATPHTYGHQQIQAPGHEPGHHSKSRGYTPRLTPSQAPGHAPGHVPSYDPVSRRTPTGPYLSSELVDRHTRATSQKSKYSALSGLSPVERFHAGRDSSPDSKYSVLSGLTPPGSVAGARLAQPGPSPVERFYAGRQGPLSDHMGIRPAPGAHSPQPGRRSYVSQGWAVPSVQDDDDVSLEGRSVSADSLSANQHIPRGHNYHPWQDQQSSDGGKSIPTTSGSRSSGSTAREAELQEQLAAQERQLSVMRAEVDATRQQQRQAHVSSMEHLQQQHGLQLQQL